MKNFSEEEIKNYHQDGYIVVRNLFSKEEINVVSTLENKDVVEGGEGEE